VSQVIQVTANSGSVSFRTSVLSCSTKIARMFCLVKFDFKIGLDGAVMATEDHMRLTGLAARVWDPSGGDEPQAGHDFVKGIIEKNGDLALDVGCGTCRLLLRYLEVGYDVEGVDVSSEMLAICREKAAKRGLKPILYRQSLHALELPRQYKTIFIPGGTFVLLIDREQAWEALRHIYEHLEPDGTFVFSLFWQFGEGEAQSERLRGGYGR
jgi:SAM-dependent methyltransferase